MFIKKLIIEDATQIIREIEFKIGLNLIIDNTPTIDTKLTGNNVGKTTVLKLVDFCLGAESKIIYTDEENKKKTYDVVKNFLINEEIIITLILVDDLKNTASKELKIKRNFLQRKKAIREINGKSILDKDFENELEKHIFPNKKIEKPSFRQLISHNIRYKDESINNTLKTLDKYTTDIEYETLYLYLLGCTIDDGAKKLLLSTQKKQEVSFKQRLEKNQTKTAYELALSLIEDEISRLNKKKEYFNLNEDFEQNLDKLNLVKYEINMLSSTISKLKIRKSLITESITELNNSVSKIDMRQLQLLYSEAIANIDSIQKTFEDLVLYHNNMIVEKVKFIGQELPTLNEKIEYEEIKMKSLLKQEKKLTKQIAKGDSFVELEDIIIELNAKHQTKGEYEAIISRIDETEKNIQQLDDEIEKIDEHLFSKEYEINLRNQIKKFNKYFAKISQELYGETYALKHEKVIKNEKQIYEFDAFNTNMSSGKKQGEILCFDLAYILFATIENIPCLHFLLNDKKELMHDNQLINVADFVQNKNIQLIISILKDKLPDAILSKAHIAIELSQEEKLFKIEK